MEKTKVALLGAGFIGEIHLESYRRFVPEAEVTAVFSGTERRAEEFARRHGIPKWYASIDELLAHGDCELVDIGLPNYLHAPVAIAAARAGKHVIIEKPLCMTLEEADEITEACRTAGRKLMYAEQLCFAPKYERVRHLIADGAIGKPYLIKQSEKHSGPHSDWFYDVDRAGGGVIMDMGCHALGWFRWMLGRAAATSVYATMSTVLHQGRTRGEDQAIMIVEFDNGVTGLAEDSWARHGGMDDRVEVYGTEGVTYADLFMGSSALTYSLRGYDYAAEKAGSTQGWTFSMFEEAFNQGYPQELRHFVQCVREDIEPLVTAEDGRAVLEMIYAAYRSASTGTKIAMPYRAHVKKPVDLWLPGEKEQDHRTASGSLR